MDHHGLWTAALRGRTIHSEVSGERRRPVRCPHCEADDDRVVDSRAVESGKGIRRRRECVACGQRFSTYERVEQQALVVRKRDGDVEPFDSAKLRAGMAKATTLPIGHAALQAAAARVEARVRALGQAEITSERLGQEVLDALRRLDPVAYLRFASVYKGFTSTEDFRRELELLDGLPGRTRRLVAAEEGATYEP
jgi:transcriptional repressor NrdR